MLGRTYFVKTAQDANQRLNSLSDLEKKEVLAKKETDAVEIAIQKTWTVHVSHAKKETDA